ncbi:MAG TPA: glycosyltransferase [Saprospiraceae bacterium]|nr:glycosyltransferase [Saprospiraceae bacterium]
MALLPNGRQIILVAVLDWGLGHATRCIPLIQQLLQQNFEVVIVGNGNSLVLLQEEFPNITTEKIIGYDIKYPFDNMVVNISFQLPKLFWAIIKEHLQLKKLHKKYHFSGIVSDNRYGCFLSDVPSVFMGHQLQIITPYRVLTKPVNFFHQAWLSLFDRIWIPDIENGLSGKLSHHTLKKVNYIGLLSRMKYADLPHKYKLVVVLSGVEPQRTKLEQLLTPQLKRIDAPTLLIQGKIGSKVMTQLSPNIDVIPYLTTTALNKAMQTGEVIICRPGYSSLMDLARLQKKAIVIPTPGQTEQEYLGKYLDEKKIVVCQNQNNIDLATALDKIQLTKGLTEFKNQDYLLQTAINAIFRKAETVS